jgi:hypothetical protein
MRGSRSSLYRRPVFWLWMVAITLAVLVADGLVARFA